jgi:malate dehydrogenase (oxaloacetate-decarboxylating)(NADP+)
VLIWESTAVAKAAMETGVAQKTIDIDAYREKLEYHLGLTRRVTRNFINKAKKDPKRIVFPEGEHESILKACEIIVDEGIAHPILLGNREIIESKIKDLQLDLGSEVEIVNPKTSDRYEHYLEVFYELRCRKGITRDAARRLLNRRNYFGSMMVHVGEADGLVSGLTQSYPETIRPALQTIGVRPDVHKVAGLYMMVLKDRVLFFADATVNIEPTAEDLAEITLLCAREVRRFDVEPRVALLSFSNFGSTKHPLAEKVRRATELVKERAPDLIVDGEMEADTAVVPEIIDEVFPFSSLKGKEGANVLIFPNLEAGNIAYKLMQRLGGARAIGPILLGMRKPVHVLQVGGFDEIDVLNMTAIAVIDAQSTGQETAFLTKP